MRVLPRAAASKGSFEAGIQLALRRILASPSFVFRVEEEPRAGAGRVYRISDVELASRLSFFLWSSIPDDDAARRWRQRGRLSDPAVLEPQVRRMLADPKARGARRQLRRPVAAPAQPARTSRRTHDEFPDFDDNLRAGLPARDRAVLRQHHARGPQRPRPADGRLHVRQRAAGASTTASRTSTAASSAACTLTDEARRGLLGKGSILMVTSHADRTSPVLRGKWILENLLGDAAAAAAGERAARWQRQRARGAEDDARADGGAPRQPGLCRLPPRRWTRSASRSRTSTRVGAWRTRDAGAAGRRVRRSSPTAPRSTVSWRCGRRCCSGPTCSSAR